MKKILSILWLFAIFSCTDKLAEDIPKEIVQYKGNHPLGKTLVNEINKSGAILREIENICADNTLLFDYTTLNTSQTGMEYTVPIAKSKSGEVISFLILPVKNERMNSPSTKNVFSDLQIMGLEGLNGLTKVEKYFNSARFSRYAYLGLEVDKELYSYAREIGQRNRLGIVDDQGPIQLMARPEMLDIRVEYDLNFKTMYPEWGVYGLSLSDRRCIFENAIFKCVNRFWILKFPREFTVTLDHAIFGIELNGLNVSEYEIREILQLFIQEVEMQLVSPNFADPPWYYYITAVSAGPRLDIDNGDIIIPPGENPGGSGGGLGGDSGNGGASPLFDSIFNSTNTNLLQVEQDSLSTHVESFVERYPLFKKMIKMLINKGKMVGIGIEPARTKGNPGKYDPNLNYIFYRDFDCMISDTSIEEFIHWAQYQGIYTPTTNPGEKNIEFEAKVFYDIFYYDVLYVAYGLPFFGLLGEDQSDYIDFLDQVKINGFSDNMLEWYHELGSKWNDPAYKGTYDSNKDPELIKTLLQ